MKLKIFFICGHHLQGPTLKVPLKLRPAPVPGLQVHLEHLPALVPGLKVLLLHLPTLVPGLSLSLRGVRPKILNIFENNQNIL